MPEIERKWLVNQNAIPWNTIAQASDYKKIKMTQQYLELPTKENPKEMRVRKVEGKDKIQYYKTIKSYNENQALIREENEYEITKEEFDKLYNKDKGNIIEKTRHIITLNNVKYEMDAYKKPNGLLIVEVEFDSLNSANEFKVPCWFGKEVTEDMKYKNVNLAQNGLNNEKKITEIVLTGGPCGGKSTILSELKRSFEEKGFKVLVSKEVATEVMESGAKPWEVPTYIFQGAIMDTMLNNEKNMKLLAEDYRQKGQDVIIFYDRGLADNRAYCDEETWKALLEERGLNVEGVHSMYDAVYNIETTAYGAENVFIKQLGNNPSRYENTIEMAREAEDRTKKAWNGHHNLLIFGNDDLGWQGKQDAIFDETYRILGMKPLIRYDKRYLVDIPENLPEFLENNNCIKQEIEQIYLKSNSNVEYRIRKINDGEFAVYYYTEKEGEGKNKIVREKIIDEELYNSYLSQTDVTRKSIKKTRYSFVQGQEYFVLDIFSKGEYKNLPEGKAIVESKGTINLNNKAIEPQGFLNIEDITNSKEYTNIMLAKKNNNELFR